MKFILALIFSFSLSFLSAQLNDKHIYVDVKENVLEEIEINSLLVPKVQVHDYNLTDSIGFEQILPGTTLYKINYQSIPGLAGDFQTVIEYTEPSSIPGIPQTNYLVLHVRVKSSKVSSKDDYALSSGSSIIDPLLNDSSTDGPLSLVKLGHVSGGTASITSDNKIDFSLNGGQGTILYFIEDSLGNTASAYLRVTEESNTISYSKSRFLTKNSTLEIVLPSADYSALVSPSNGSISNSIDHSHVWTYVGDSDYSGNDFISFESSAGGVIEYDLSVLNTNNDNSFVIDDEIFVAADGSVSFDVLANDFRADAPIIFHSPELSELDNGVYEYTAPAGFIGDVEFVYKVFTGLQVFTGEILIHVDNFAPTTSDNYTFEIIQDQALRITHNTPIDSYFFDDLGQPTHGTVQVFDEFDNELIGCDSVSGINTIIYTPTAGYTGADEFDLQYCTDPSNCEVVKVDVNVLSSSYTDCLCIEGCVFEGDHNDDGRVDFLDILDLGLNVGEGGIGRTNDFTETWSGQYSNNWGHTQMGSNTDLKCGDSDGDGYIDADDLLAIDNYYGKLSKFQTVVPTATTEVPVYFIPQQTEVDSGEVLILDIVIGDPSYPAIYMNGLAFSFNMAAELMDSSSVNFYLYDDNWLAYNNPLVDYSIVPQDGRVDIAVTRLGRQSASGHGIIGALEFIVEDEIHGLKRAKNAVEQLTIEMSDIISVNGYGDYVSHPNYSQKITVDSHDDTITDEITFAESISIFPNPTTGLIQVSSSGPEIDKMSITDVVGRTIAVPQISTSKGQYIDLSGYEDGVYFISVHSGEELTTKKVHKVDI